MAILPQVDIWTDGSCHPNPGPGGWAAVLMFAKHGVELSGYDPDATNNRMEMRAAIEALQAIGYPAKIRLHSDSQYLVIGMSERLSTWRRTGPPEKNRDLWQALMTWAEYHEIEWRWIRGHNGDEHNERADALAGAARQLLMSRTAA